MTRTRLVGFIAMAFCVLGYSGFALAVVAMKMDYLTLTQGAVVGGVLAVIGEIGLWVGAGCLGLTLFRKRKAMFDRIFRRKSVAPQI